MYNLEQNYLTKSERSNNEVKRIETIMELESRIQDIKMEMIDCTDDELEDLEMELDELECEIRCLA